MTATTTTASDVEELRREALALLAAVEPWGRVCHQQAPSTPLDRTAGAEGECCPRHRTNKAARQKALACVERLTGGTSDADIRAAGFDDVADAMQRWWA